ncbi:MAG: hypothetical protein M8861_07700 [marine benthic group bacterium]|nr:hypothetical protein [Gemmatimonadota bacterium]
MRVEFDEEFGVPVEEAYEYFRTPLHWPRLFRAFGPAEDRGDGWYAVPFRGFPFPLVTRITRDDPGRCVEWVFDGFWRGDARVEFERTTDGVVIRGYEQVSPHSLSWLAPLAERLFLDARFQRVWESGWRRLRRASIDGENAATPGE